jgi:hypothetical protein
MKRFHVARPARRDLLEIWARIAADGGAPTADRVIAAPHRFPRRPPAPTTSDLTSATTPP